MSLSTLPWHVLLISGRKWIGLGLAGFLLSIPLLGHAAPRILEPDGSGGEAHVARASHGNCGTLFFNAATTYDTGLALSDGFSQLPDIGSLAECYPNREGYVCAAVFDFTLEDEDQQDGEFMDVYVWEDDDGTPGAVLCLEPNVDPGPIETWPLVSRHEVSLPDCEVSGFFVGYWGNWPGSGPGWYVAAATGANNACGHWKSPDGWTQVGIDEPGDVVMGIGARVIPLDELGACCFSDGTCVVLSGEDCDGTFAGPNTTCDPNPCEQPAACCFSMGTCELRIADECDQMGGIHLPDEFSCDPNPCPDAPVGACCLAELECQVLDLFTCQEIGIFRGADTSCEPNPCDMAVGACCTYEGTCDLREEDDCGDNFLGDGSLCNPNPCPQPDFGACCFSDGMCTELNDRDCDDEGGTFLGDGSNCIDSECRAQCEDIPRPRDPGAHQRGQGPNGGGTLLLHAESAAYSFGQDYCGTSTLTDCEEAVFRVETTESVVFHMFGAFGPSSAPRVAGVAVGISYADCFVMNDFGHCGDFELTTFDWPESGEGTAVTFLEARTDRLVSFYWFSGYVDSDDSTLFSLVDHPNQVASFADDDIPANLDPVAELGALGFRTNGRLICPEGEAPGACCFSDGSCEIRTPLDCEAAGGDFQGDQTQCDPNPCPQPIGACCAADGGCTLTTEANCTGDYQGNGSRCEPNPCPVPTGACCFSDETCQVLSAEDCLAAGGTYLGNDFPCQPNPCEIVPTIEGSWGQVKSRFRGLK